LFATSCVLRQQPRLLGYYRLLLGFSQKEFYQKCRLARFAALEEKGQLSASIASELPDLCRALTERASQMAEAIGFERLTLQLLDDLTLLTLGPQLRGGHNTRIGKVANQAVFELIRKIVSHGVTSRGPGRLELMNSSGRRVTIAFCSDPDISVTEQISAATVKRMVAVEIKGGGDKSNIWNRLGEAEKSHQSAKQRGFVEFWTIYNVPDLDAARAHEKSPTTTRFYNLIELLEPTSSACCDSRDRLIAHVGLPAAGMPSA
jgi:hypothetical protein